jgi:hypothetical protein
MAQQKYISKGAAILVCLGSSLHLALIETCLLFVFLLVDGFLDGGGGLRSFSEQVRSTSFDCFNIFIARIVFGFVFVNAFAWWSIHASKITLSLLVAGLVNAGVLLALFALGNSPFDFLSHFIDFNWNPFRGGPFFGLERGAFVASLVSPWILCLIPLRPNIFWHLIKSKTRE